MHRTNENRLHRILIVDDREENIFSLENMLLDEGRMFYKTTSGTEALKIAIKEDLSLILLDVQMPEMDGFEVASLLRSTAKTRRIPIVFVTAISKESKYVVKGLQDGAIDYLFKPLDIEITRAKVATLLQFYQQQSELEQKNTELAKLNDQKNYLLGVAAHDLRNPLGNILTCSDFLISETVGLLEPDHLELLHNIKESSEFMLNLINNLLDVSKIESGKLVLNLQPTDLVMLIGGNLALNRVLAEKKNITVHFTPPHTTIEVMVDPSQLLQVMSNLVSNAIKYSNGGTTVEVLVEKQPNFILVSVRDQGQGIPSDEVGKLFHPFQKTSVQSTAGEASTGLGLAIVKKIIQAHGGQIWVESEVGKGSCFMFTLPVSDTPRPDTHSS